MRDIPSERRRFKRVTFNARTELSQAAHRWPVELIDLSFKGLLVQRPDPWSGDREQPFEVDIHLDEGVAIHMQVRFAHADQRQLGFHCLHIDLDSVSHLRRLIELNLGDEQALERELSALLQV